MSPKEKAEELVNKFYSKIDEERVLVNKHWSSAKYCALVAVDEILGGMGADRGQSFWNEVKREIEAI